MFGEAVPRHRMSLASLGVKILDKSFTVSFVIHEVFTFFSLCTVQRSLLSCRLVSESCRKENVLLSRALLPDLLHPSLFIVSLEISSFSSRFSISSSLHRITGCLPYFFCTNASFLCSHECINLFLSPWMNFKSFFKLSPWTVFLNIAFLRFRLNFIYCSVGFSKSSAIGACFRERV